MRVQGDTVLTQLAHLTRATVGGAKQLKRRAKKRLGMFGPLAILPFRGYGTPDRLFISGRLLEAKGIIHNGSRDGHFTSADGEEMVGKWANFRATVQRFRTDEVPGATLEARLGSDRVEFHTDQEGFFDVTLRPSQPLEPGWHDVELELIRSMAGSEGTCATAQVLVPPKSAEFGVISDIDDTVVHTSATDRLKMIRIVLFHNAKTRIPFPGVAAFYRALKLGPDGRGANPIFYVSRSPWNLYDLFDAFFAHQDIPRGPLFLRDLHFLESASKALGREQDKLSRIRKLLAIYPEMQFVLVGDSGQQDPEVYRDIALEHPGRIKAIYIRDVVSKRRDREVHAIAEELEAHGVPVLLCKETLQVAEHAARLGLISDGALPEIGHRAEIEEREET